MAVCLNAPDGYVTQKINLHFIGSSWNLPNLGNRDRLVSTVIVTAFDILNIYSPPQMQVNR